MEEHVGMFPQFLNLEANLLIIKLLQIIEKGKSFISNLVRIKCRLV
jgi:hypothetical protein